MNTYDLKAAHETARFNRDALARDHKCGCFHCLKIFAPSEIEEWCSELDEDDEVTTICPYCGVDAVLPESSEYPLTTEFLSKMRERWF